MASVGIVGGGVAGLTCARRMTEAGFRVTVLDEGRGPAGRASTHRIPAPGIPGRGSSETVPFDHGAQYFTARDARFRRQVAAWRDAGVVDLWEPRLVSQTRGKDPGGAERYVGVPGMSAPGARLARGLDVRWNRRVVSVREAGDGGSPDGGTWVLRTAGGAEAGPFDAVVVTVPAPDAAPLLEGAAPRLSTVGAGHHMLPCLAVMASFDSVLPAPFDAAFLEDGPLSWVARNSSKPKRPERPDAWVLHAGPDWSAVELETDAGEVERRLLAAFFQAAGVEPRPPSVSQVHRWRWARSSEPRRDGCLLGADGSLILAGDWLAGDRVEGAFLSGWEAAGRILGRD